MITGIALIMATSMSCKVDPSKLISGNHDDPVGMKFPTTYITYTPPLPTSVQVGSTFNASWPDIGPTRAGEVITYALNYDTSLATLTIDSHGNISGTIGNTPGTLILTVTVYNPENDGGKIDFTLPPITITP